jgi:caa(3)-type oxidase subunit IV
VTTQAGIQDQTHERRVVWLVWGALVSVTVAGWRLVQEGGAEPAIFALVVLLGLAKCWLIVQHFMDVRHAPRWLQFTTTCWMAILWLTLLVLFLRG